MKTFTFYSDPSHAWLAVTETDVALAGLNKNSFSRYSYSSGNTLFLEEDRDAIKFLDCWAAKFGHPNIRDMQDGEFIRNFNSIRS